MILSKVKPVDEGTVIMAVEQYAGKGQQGASWHADASKNLTASIVLCPQFINPSQQFRLNIAISLAIYSYLSNYLSEGLKIKWPNDIYVGNKKIAGILIENILQGSKWLYSIVGVGLNINQCEFDNSTTSRPTSLHIESGKSYDIKTEFSAISLEIERRYSQLKAGEYEQQKKEYTQLLYRLDEIHPYEIDGIRVEGKITGINEEGKLLVNFNGYTTDFDLKEIAYVF